MLYRMLIAAVLALTTVFALPQNYDRISSMLDNRIFGGKEARPGQFSHQISLRINTSIVFEHTCGGSIISDRFILTAAHCYPRRFPNVSDYRVVVGAHENNGNDGQAYDVKRFIVHEGWDRSKILNDIALVEVNEPIAFNERVAAIPLRRKFVGGGNPAIVSGWGRSNVSQKSIKHMFLFRPLSIFSAFYSLG